MLVGLGGVLAAGGAASAFETGAFTSIDATRSTNISAASDPANAFVGLQIHDPVQKNNQETLVDVENNTGQTIDVTVSLDDCTQGTLSDSDQSGCSVTLTLSPGVLRSVDIEASVAETIPFSISASSPDFSLDATRQTTAETGNVKSALRIGKVQQFRANTSQNNWTIKQVQVQDRDNDDDLDRVEYEITDSDGTVRATRTDSAAGGQYQQQNITIGPDSPLYFLVPGETYTLTVTAYDADGNFVTATRTDTASGGGGGLPF